MKNWVINAMIVSFGAWSILMVGHEMIGHGLATIIFGGTPVGVNGMYFEHDLSMLPANHVRWVQASGSIFNILLGFLTFSMLSMRINNYWLKYFLWVTAVYNLLHAGSYIGLGRFIHEGMDWAMILNGVQNRILWGALEVVGSLLLIAAGCFVAIRYGSILSISSSAARIFWVPLLASTTAAVISACLVPSDDFLMMLMGGIGNGFIFLFPLLIIGLVKMGVTGESKETEPEPLPGGILIVSVLMTCFYLVVMSPGLTF